MIHRPQSAVASYVSDLLASGKVVFSSDEARQATHTDQGAFLDAAEKLQKRHYLFSPRRGFYIVVPSQYLKWGSPPPTWFIDDLMRHEGRPYYVGLLKAAELHGTAHQAVMEFQVITDKRLPAIPAGRSKIAFYFKKKVSTVAAGIEDHKTETGRMKVSSAELTILDLLRYPQASGGLDNIITIIADLGRKLNYRKFLSLSTAFERSILQRVGYLLDHAGFAKHTDGLHKALQRRSRLWVELEPPLIAKPELAPPVVERDGRWQVIVRRIPEQDE
jgi:predicted transcriptional regulator of viral defense system